MGEVQLEYTALSRLHSNVDDSFDEKVKLAVVALVVPLGPESMLVSGGVLSTVTVTPSVAGELRTLDGEPAPDVALNPYGVAVRLLTQD